MDTPPDGGAVGMRHPGVGLMQREGLTSGVMWTIIAIEIHIA